MGTDRELYEIAIQKEQDYLDYINTFYSGYNFPTLSEALKTMFHTKGINISHKDGLTKTQGYSILRAFEKNGSIANVLKDGASSFIAKEVSQIKGLKDTGDALKKKVAGYVDEVFLVSQLKQVFDTMVRKDGKDIPFVPPIIEYQGSLSSDFTVVFKNIQFTQEGRNGGFYSEIKRYINLENKLNLSHFHITTDTLKTGEIGINTILNDFFYIMKEKHPDLNIGIDDYLMGKYVSYIRKDDFNQILANYIMYKKLSTSIPVFVSPDSTGINFKLCSEVIREVGNGNFKLDTGIEEGEKFQAIGTNAREIKTELIDKAIKKVGKYSLWYGRP